MANVMNGKWENTGDSFDKNAYCAYVIIIGSETLLLQNNNNKLAV